VLARELTKKFEEFLRGKPAALLAIAQKRSLKGEFVVLVAGAEGRRVKGAAAAGEAAETAETEAPEAEAPGESPRPD
jgi:16S rRNA C1402 (ribose-2'-O) methylase RsmI